MLEEDPNFDLSAKKKKKKKKVIRYYFFIPTQFFRISYPNPNVVCRVDPYPHPHTWVTWLKVSGTRGRGVVDMYG
jgi:hypothetical protein